MRKKNKGSQQKEYPWHPFNPGRSLFPAVHRFLLEVDSIFPKSFNGTTNIPGLAFLKSSNRRGGVDGKMEFSEDLGPYISRWKNPSRMHGYK
jgi:hypothetical protein